MAKITAATDQYERILRSALLVIETKRTGQAGENFLSHAQILCQPPCVP